MYNIKPKAEKRETIAVLQSRSKAMSAPLLPRAKTPWRAKGGSGRLKVGLTPTDRQTDKQQIENSSGGGEGEGEDGLK